MIRLLKIMFLLLPFLMNDKMNAQSSENGFTIIPLGVKGGLDESNLSAYLVKANGAEQFICLDAGTIYAGLHKATNTGIYHPTNDPTDFQKNISIVILFLMVI